MRNAATLMLSPVVHSLGSMEEKPIREEHVSSTAAWALAPQVNEECLRATREGRLHPRV